MDPADYCWFDASRGDEMPGEAGWILVHPYQSNPNQHSQVWRAEKPGETPRIYKIFHDGRGDFEDFLRVCVREKKLRDRLGSDTKDFVAEIVASDFKPPPPGSNKLYAPFIELIYFPLGSFSKALEGKLHGFDKEINRLGFIAQAADLLNALHKRGVYHGDLRAANLLIRQDSEADPRVCRLTDLGNGGFLVADDDVSAPAAEPLGGASVTSSSTSIVDPEVSPSGYASHGNALAEPSGRSIESTLDRLSREVEVPVDGNQIASDIASIGKLLYQSEVCPHDSNPQLIGLWRDKVRCPVLRRVIEDTQRSGFFRDAAQVAARIRSVPEARQRIKKQRLMALFFLIFFVAVLMGGGWYIDARARTLDLVSAGDRALLHGDWRGARDLYRLALGRLVQPDLRDQARIHQKVVRASIFLDENELADESLAWHGFGADHQAGGPPLMLDEAVLELEKVMQASTKSNTDKLVESETNAIKLLRLVANHPAAEEADRLTAWGMLAVNYDDSKRNFDAALTIEPFHPYAAMYLTSTSMLAGRLDEAIERARIWEMMGREDPAPLLNLAFILAMRGDQGGAAKVLGRINATPGKGPTLPPETLNAYRVTIEVIGAMNDLLADALLDGIARLKFTALMVFKLPAAMNGLSSTGSFRIPLIPAQRAAYRQLFDAMVLGFNLSGPKPRDALKKLENLGSLAPEGLVQFFRGKFLIDLGEMQMAAAALERGASLPSTLDVRRISWLTAANYHTGLAGRLNGEAAEQHKREGRRLLRHALAVGPSRAVFRNRVADMLQRCGDSVLASDLAGKID